MRDEREAAPQGRQQREGDDDVREAIVLALTRCALIVILLVIKTLFSSFNGVDLSHIMLVDWCMLCCWECGPIAAV